jgi:hypothetical protein
MEDQIKMDKKSQLPIMKVITVGCILLLLVFANSMMNYSYAAPPQFPIKPSITITADSSSLYSIPSTFVKVERFSSNYIIAGKISSINASRELITSTIVDDFDKNPNIGYVVSNSSSLNPSSQPGLPNPFVSMDILNQKITNGIRDTITATSVSSPAGKNVEIKCTFGTILSDYKCS